MSTTADELTDADDIYARKWWAFSAIGISYFTMVMTSSMVFVALSAMADDFHVTLRVITWIVIIESLILSALMLPAARVGDIVGRRRIHMIGVWLFGAGAVFVALAPTFPLLIVARIVMAVGSTLSQAVGTAMTVSIFPPHERGKALGSSTTAVSIGGATGPVVGGLLLQVMDWRVLFFLLLIPVALGLVASVLYLDERRVNEGAANGAGLDLGGAILSGIFVTGAILVINNPFGVSWLSPGMLAGTVVSLIALGGFLRWERAYQHPMIDLALFRNRDFSAAVIARILGFMAQATLRVLLPLYLISLRGLAEGAAGGVLFLIALGMGLAAQASGRLSDQFGERRFVIGGLGVTAICGLGFALMDETTAMWQVAVAVFIFGLASGTWNVPNGSMMIGTAPASSLGVVAAISNLTRNLGNVVGQALATAAVVAVMAARDVEVPLSEISETPGASEAFISGWQLSFLILAVYAVLAVISVAVARPRAVQDRTVQDSAIQD